MLSGGLQPFVTPADANALMSPSNTEPSSSVKKSTDETGKARARRTNAAIWPRVTSESGQYRSFVGGLQPLVIPAAAIASVLASWMLPLSSVNVPPGGNAADAPLASTATARDSDRQRRLAATRKRSSTYRRLRLAPTPSLCHRIVGDRLPTTLKTAIRNVAAVEIRWRRRNANSRDMTNGMPDEFVRSGREW